MKLYRHQGDLQRGLSQREGSLGFVPTMGALHDGHLSLIHQAQEDNDEVAVSIFVNPLQFGVNEDLTSYPRTEEADLAKLTQAGVDHVLVGEATDLYPQGFCTTIELQGEVAQVLEGERRPGHFNGVCTVVGKLFHLFQPTRAYFGWKDFQQVCVLKRMVKDLAFPVEIHACPIRREVDGLAMSSRNRFLGPENREKSTRIYTALANAQAAAQAGQDDTRQLCEDVIHSLAGLFDVEYLEVRDQEDFALVDSLAAAPGRARMLIVARLGGVRLLDNLLLNAP
jgi:pantoate--beta-alanine ligase